MVTQSDWLFFYTILLILLVGTVIYITYDLYKNRKWSDRASKIYGIFYLVIIIIVIFFLIDLITSGGSTWYSP